MKRTSTQRCLAAAVMEAGLVCLVVSPVFAQGNPLRDAYFGELHVHTSWSLDAWLFGNRVTDPGDAYKYFKGETIKHPLGYDIKIETPLDFAGVTDHSEYVGVMKLANDPSSPISKLPAAAPLILKNKVLVATSGGDDGVRGFVAAYDALTGKLAWRFWTIPGPGEFGSESWPGKLYLHGGGTTWMPGTYDPQLNTIYWGTSNPAPDFEGGVRPGDDLYTDCVLALDPDAGKLKWYFQFTPHDLFDYDAVETPILIDAVYQGTARKLLVQANRNGYIYVLDRTNGKFLSATPFVDKLNWAKGVDAQGRPELTNVRPTAEGTRVCPGYSGATNWFAPSYSDSTHSVYFMALEECETYFFKPQTFQEGHEYYSTGVKRIPGEPSQKVLVAFNLDTNSIAWKYPQTGSGRSSGGTMTTAGGLVFFGDDAGSFEAVDARTGKALWHFNTGQEMSASPMTYAIAGKQYVAVAAGSDIFSFALP